MSKDKRLRLTAGVSLIPRRQFLVLGSAAIAGAVTTGVSGQIMRTLHGMALGAPTLSLGYIAAAIGDFNAAPSESHDLLAAESLPSSDAILAESVRLRVHGLVRQQDSTPVSVNLDVLYHLAGYRNERVPFHAWSYNGTRNGATAGSAAGFVVPVSAKHPVVMSLSSGSGAGTSCATTTLCSGNDPGTNKLRRGLYCLALMSPGAKAPNWALIRAVSSKNERLPVLQQAVGLRYEPVPFPYLVLSADVHEPVVT